MNLLQETENALQLYAKSPKDVVWCGSEEYGYFDWQTFERLADIDYDNGYGGQEVAKDLLIVGTDWWLERQEYDGSEWWEYKTFPNKPSNKEEPKTLTAGYSWDTLKEKNEQYELEAN